MNIDHIFIFTDDDGKVAGGWLNLTFDNGKQRKKRDFDKLQLTTEY